MANSNTTTPSLTDLMPTNNDLKPWSTTDIPVLSPTLDNYYDWSSIVQAMVDFHDATHLLTTNPAPLEQRLAKQLIFFVRGEFAGGRTALVVVFCMEWGCQRHSNHRPTSRAIPCPIL
jgi:hypothetical protein